jgi:molybdopterin converting factor small subunit
MCDVRDEFLPFIIPFVNNEHAEAARVLQENDECKLFLPVSGG